MFNRIVIVNRGEPAMRLIHAVRELSTEIGTRIEVVALHTDVDRTATFVREADISYDLGPASANPYLDLEVLERALVQTGADAAWGGWGFVAEDPAFAELCERIGVTFVGPSADSMRKLGDKIGAKLIAEEVGVPVAPWSRGAVETLNSALATASEIGYPLMLKATAGGGGRGIRIVANEAELVDAYERTSNEAARSFSSGVVFLERLVVDARHVEVQVIADGKGRAWALGVRDCTVQRRNQKIIEESASPTLSPVQTKDLKMTAERLAITVRYQGAATVEFLYRPDDGLLAFLEVNTRLQVEHPVTEATTGFDLVKAQLRVAFGEALNGRPPVERGHAIEARLNAEDPDRDFAPAPGRIVRLSLPAGPGVRVDTGVGEGDTIPAEFDSMIAKIIAYGHDRHEALGRLRRAVAQTIVVTEGGATNKGFLLDLLDRPEVIEASADTGWIDRTCDTEELVSHQGSTVALVAAAIETYENEERIERQRLLSTASGGKPQTQHERGRPVDLTLRGVGYRLRVARRVGVHRFRVGIEAGNDLRTADVELDRIDPYTAHIAVNGVRYRLLAYAQGPFHLVEVDGVAHQISLSEDGLVRSPAPALVVSTPLPVGGEVEAGAPVLVIESMKMETVLRAPFRARLKEYAVSVGNQVESGTALLRLEPLGDEAEAKDTSVEAVDLDLPAPAESTAWERAKRGQEDLRGSLLGFDVDPHDERRVLDNYLAARWAATREGQRPLAGELALVNVFTDLIELDHNQPIDGESGVHSGDSHVHSAREYFHVYMLSLDIDRAALPKAFQAKLTRALQHYRVNELHRCTELEAAVFHIFLAQQRAYANAESITTLLQTWLREPPPTEALREPVGLALERLVAATQERFPTVSDLARRVAFAWFRQPRLRRTRARVYTEARKHLRYLDAHPAAPERVECVAAMARSTEPLVRLLGRRLIRGVRDNTITLEVLTRRYYDDQRYATVRTSEVESCKFVIAERVGSSVISAGVSFEAFDSTLRALGELARNGQINADTVDVDIYLACEKQIEDGEEIATTLQEIISEHPLPSQVSRLNAIVIGSGGTPMHHHFTFRQTRTGFSEERLIRGMHPHIAQRMRLKRLREFHLTQLPSADEDVYLFRCVARENPTDDRLAAFAHVRHLTEVREHDDTLVALPAAEDTIAACLDSIRHAQAVRPRKERFATNQVVCYVWPPSDTTRAQLETIARRVLSTTEGAGLEEILLIGRQRDRSTSSLTEIALRVTFDSTGGTELTVSTPPVVPVKPIDNYRSKVLGANNRNTIYPYELADLLGSFVEYDLDNDGELVTVDRPKGHNTASIVVGVVTTRTQRYPEGVSRVVLFGDSTKALGAVSAPECCRVIAALDLAERMRVPLEWYAFSAGAWISMDSGTETMDWVAAALKRIVEFTQNGGEINVVMTGINVGAQPYWNAEATMLMHTKGILVMTPDSAMVLTGKRSLDFSGGVSAEDNLGIGGYDRVMGPNGQAQYWAPNLAAALDVLMTHYDHTYITPGEQAPRRRPTSDPANRDISDFPHTAPESSFARVGDIFSHETNPDRKKPFDIRSVMRALADQDSPALERWAGMADAESVVVQDVHLGGVSVCLLGIESRGIARRGFPPADGPDTYTAGTLFPQSSKKAARAINAASGNRPLVVLANLSGFDSSPESMRKLQLEYGAEIARAIVNFRGPIVSCGISRYHGGPFVVFSKALNPNITVLALEGSFASILGGAPAAAVVFSSDVDDRTENDPRVRHLAARAATSSSAEHAALAAKLDELRSSVRVEKRGEVASEFDRVHSVERAVEVGSVDAIIRPDRLRPAIIEAIESGLREPNHVTSQTLRVAVSDRPRAG